MKLSVKMLLLLYCILITYSADGKSDGKDFNEKDLDKVRLDAKGFDKIKTIHTNWYVHSMKALIAQLSRNLLPKLSDDIKKEFVECLSKIHDKKDLVESSKCVIRAREQYQVQRQWQPRSDPSWADTYKALIILKKKMDEKEKEPGARVYNERMYDLVLDVPQKENGFAMFDKKKMPNLMRHAFDLMSTIEKNSKQAGDSNIKFLSPRFAAVMPDKNENRGRLSPSILSFYNDESEDQILPLPKMLDSTGMREKDRDSIIELVMEISGVKGIVHGAMKMLKSTEMPELDVAMNENAKKSLQMVQDIQKSYKRKQKSELKKNGFTLMDPLQMEKLMTEQGILGREDIFNLKEYALMTISQRKEMVWDMVRGIAYGITGMKASRNSTNSRVKRQSSVWGPHILQPTVLSPILFTPIYGLNVLGPTVLSPGLFTPLILNPAVLSPYVFSPTVGIPFILSPYLLSPYVFSPLVMAPFILNPYVLAPNVFNPYVLSPLILSPLVICPDVVSPMTLGGAILSPAVLSPSVLSKSYIMANVLSPTFLS